MKKGEEVAVQLPQAFEKQSGRPKSKSENCYLHPPF